MNSLSTETFPYTISYVCELLKADEPKVLAICNRVNIQPHRNERTGHLFFGQKDIDTLRRVLESDASRAGQNQIAPSTPDAKSLAASKSAYNSVPQRSSTMTRADLSVIVDSVSNVKEEILRDLSQLLDDKLCGLDEVVVELIRSKSENDSLREELKRVQENRDYLRGELTKYKPAAFGFYRKED